MHTFIHSQSWISCKQMQTIMFLASNASQLFGCVQLVSSVLTFKIPNICYINISFILIYIHYFHLSLAHHEISTKSTVSPDKSVPWNNMTTCHRLGDFSLKLGRRFPIGDQNHAKWFLINGKANGLEAYGGFLKNRGTPCSSSIYR